MKTLVINTGGTIDSEAYGDNPPEFGVQNCPSMLPGALAVIGGDYEYAEWEKMADSQQFDELDYARLAEFINEAPYERFVITHGTDKMPDLGRFLKHRVDPAKTVLLTGAMLPLANGVASDGFANLEYTLGAAAAAGVHIAFGGKLFDPENMRKNKAARRFEVIG